MYSKKYAQRLKCFIYHVNKIEERPKDEKRCDVNETRTAPEGAAKAFRLPPPEGRIGDRVAHKVETMQPTSEKNP